MKTKTYKFKLSDGTTGRTNLTKKEFKKDLLDEIKIVEWNEEDLA